jgi:CHASE3 domain sensor protein
MAVVLVSAIAFPQNLAAQATQHLVSPDDLQKAAVDASQNRQQNIDTLNGFLSSDQAQKALQSAHVTPQQVKKAVAGMSDEELAQLASRAQKAQSDFAGGLGTTTWLLIIVVILVVIIVAAVH